MERFALAAAVVLGFALTATLCSLFVPLRRVLERREQQQQPVQSEQPRPAPLRAPLWGGLCAAAGTVAAVGVGWLAACVGQPELLGSEGRLMTRLLTALAGSLAFGAVGLAEDVARMRSPAALGLRRDVRLLLEALAAAFVLLLLRAAPPARKRPDRLLPSSTPAWPQRPHRTPYPRPARLRGHTRPVPP